MNEESDRDGGGPVLHTGALDGPVQSSFLGSIELLKLNVEVENPIAAWITSVACKQNRLNNL